MAYFENFNFPKFFAILKMIYLKPKENCAIEEFWQNWKFLIV